MLSIDTNIDDLGWPWTAVRLKMSWNFGTFFVFRRHWQVNEWR